MRYGSIRVGRFSAGGLAILTMVVATGCKPEEGGGDAPKKTGTDMTAAALPDQLFVEQPSEGARSVADVKADASATDKVVVRGRIGGRKKLFVDGAAVFLLADTSMKSCRERHTDKCPTPWDYCCEDPDSLGGKVVTVQIVGDDGRPLHVDLQGRDGFDPLATVVVEGKVAHRNGAGSLVINAEHIYVEPEGG